MTSKNRLTNLIHEYELFFSIMSVLLSGIIIIYTNFYSVPLLKYDNPTYDLDNMSVSGIFLRNEGHGTAREVSIFIESNKEMKNIKISTNEQYKIYSGGKNQKNIGVQLDKLVAGGSVNIYLLTDESPNIKPLITYENGIAEPTISYSTFSTDIYWYSIIFVIIVFTVGIYIYYINFKKRMETIRSQLFEVIFDVSDRFTKDDWLALGLASSNLTKKYLGAKRNERAFHYHLVQDILVPNGRINNEIEKISIYKLATTTGVLPSVVDDLLAALEKYRLITIVSDTHIKLTELGKKTFDFVLFYISVGLDLKMFKPLSK